MVDKKRIHKRTYRTLLAWRTAHRLSQREAAEFLGISQPAYARYEIGTRTPHKDILKRIIERTTVSLASLVRVA